MDLTRRLDDLRSDLSHRLGARGPSLGRQLRRLGRSLPRAMRSDAATLARAEQMAAHPRLARLIDGREAARAHARLRTHLRAIDPVARSRARLLDRLALIAFYVLVAVGLVVAFAWGRGLV